jgi:hypothetical protein
MKRRRTLFDWKMAYIASILCFPGCVGGAFLTSRSQEHSGFLFYVMFGVIWGALWLHGTWTQLARLRLARFWIIPIFALQFLPIPAMPRLVALIARTGLMIAQIAFACLPPRPDPATSIPNRTSEPA